jgi:hypothetical protein
LSSKGRWGRWGRYAKGMARSNDARGGTAGDVAEIAQGKASAADKREAGFVKRGRRLVPGKSTPYRFRKAFNIRKIKPRKGQT